MRNARKPVNVGLVCVSLLLSLFAVTIFSINVSAEAPAVAWQQVITVDNRNAGYWDAIQTRDGGYLLNGYSWTSTPLWVLTKVNGMGEQQWSKTYGTRGYSYNCVVETSDGGFAVGSRTDYGLAVFKTDSNGNVLWSKNCSIPDSWAWGIRQIDDGYLIAGSQMAQSSGNKKLLLVKLDSGGTVLWNRTYDGAGPAIGYDVIRSPDGGYVLLGDSEESEYIDAHHTVYLIKTDDQGNEQWRRTYGNMVFCRKITACRDGYILGTSNQWDHLSSVNFIKTDFNGAVVWVKDLIKENVDCWYSQLTEDNGYLITGDTVKDKYACIQKFNESGVEQWNLTIEKPVRVVKAHETGDGGYILFACGATLDITLIKLEPKHGEISFAQATYDVMDNASAVVVTISRTNGSNGVVSVDYSTANGTAYGWSNYLPASGTLTFNDSESSKTITIGILENNTADCGTFSIALSNPANGAMIGNYSDANISITRHPESSPASIVITSHPEISTGSQSTASPSPFPDIEMLAAIGIGVVLYVYTKKEQ